MKTNKKLSLSSIKVKSFITSLDDKNKYMVKGGTAYQEEPTEEHTCTTNTETESTHGQDGMCAGSEVSGQPTGGNEMCPIGGGNEV